MFCSWGAEEYGLIGSTEWVEVSAGDGVEWWVPVVLVEVSAGDGAGR